MLGETVPRGQLAERSEPGGNCAERGSLGSLRSRLFPSPFPLRPIRLREPVHRLLPLPSSLLKLPTVKASAL